jgi:hypothetical protein
VRSKLWQYVAVLVTVVLTAACSGEGTKKQPGVLSAPKGWMPDGASPPAVLGVKWDWDRLAVYEPYLRSFAGGDTFYELVWCDVEPTPGAVDWSRIDEVVDGAAGVGFEMNLKIRTGSCWATDAQLDARGGKKKTASLLPTDLGAYQDFVRAVVTRYAPRGVHRYAVENEVNGNGFWQSTTADYERIVRIASTVIRAADPRAIVLDGGISATAYGAGVAQWLLDQDRDADAVAAYNAFYERRFAVRGEQLPEAHDAAGLRVALKGDQPARNVAFLEATFRLAADGVLDAYQLHFYEPWGNVPLLLSYLRTRLPADLPVESWETGIFWRDGDETAMSDETAKLTSLLLAGGVRRVIWLPTAHDPEGRKVQEDRWGLFGLDDQPRASALLFRDMAKTAAGATVQGLPGDQVRGVALSHDERTVMILWSDSTAHLTAPLPAGSEVRSVDGGTGPGDRAALALDRTPLLVTVPATADATLSLIR